MFQNLRVALYLDGAGLDQIKNRHNYPQVQGFTTNPSLIRKIGVENYLEFAREAAELSQPLPISMEVVSEDAGEILRQAQILSSLSSNVVVKIPVVTSKGIPNYKTIKELTQLGISLNITAVFTKNQIIEIFDVLPKSSNAIISIFAGRIADAGIDPVPIVSFGVETAESLPGTRILWASPREIFNVVQADSVGCHIITMTDDLWRKLSNLGKNLELFSMETVEMFQRDAEESGFYF